LDVADPGHPVPLGRYAGVAVPAGDLAVAREWVYVAAGDGLVVVDVTDPTSPAGAGAYRFETLPGTGRDAAVAGRYAYVAAGEDGLQVVDLSDPANPRVMSGLETAGHAWDVALAGGDPAGHTYAYVADEYNGLRIVDVSDPLQPVEVGYYDVPGPLEFFHGVAVAGSDPPGPTYAYVADGGLGVTGLRVVDVADPGRPVEVAWLPLAAPQQEGLPARVEDVGVANSYVYLAAGTAGLRVVDVSDPGAPREVGSYDTPGRADNLVVSGHFVYLCDGDLRILDVAEPAAPALVGFYDLPEGAGTPAVAIGGPLGHTYAYVTGGGIRILDVSDASRPVEVAAHTLPEGKIAVRGEKVYVVGDSGFWILDF
jgi:hypothetical protein